MRFGKGLLLGFAVASLAGHAQAVTVVEYNFDGGSQAATSVAPGITAGAANFDTWFGGATLPDFDAGSGSAFARTNATFLSGATQELSDALSRNNYLSFTIDGTGYGVENISYTHSLNSAVNGASYASYLFSSKTGFNEGDQLASTALQTGTLSETVNLDTSGISALQGLSEEIEIRIYLSDDRANADVQVHFLDSISVSGVPEPGSLALLGIGGVCVIWRRRRA